MEASDLTILLFFTIVILVLLAFFLWLYISHRTTPPSQRLAQWLKSQSEADLLVETMAAQTECILDGLRLCGHRNTMKRRRLQQRAAAAAEAATVTSAATGPSTAAAGDHGLGGVASRAGRHRFWRPRTQDSLSPTQSSQRQRPTGGLYEKSCEDNLTSVTVAASSDWHGAEDEDMDGFYRRMHRPYSGNPAGDYLESQQQQKRRLQQQHQVELADLEELAEDRTWEYVAGWCLIVSLFCGIAIVIVAAIKAEHDPGHEETHWSLSDEGDSLMDSVISHIMRVAAGGVHQFQDQWIEQGIFIYVLGINGFLLIRQRVFARRRLYQTHLRQALPPPPAPQDRILAARRTTTAATAGAAAKATGADKTELDEEKLNSGDEDDEDGFTVSDADNTENRAVDQPWDRGFGRYPEFHGRGSTLLPIAMIDHITRQGNSTDRSGGVGCSSSWSGVTENNSSTEDYDYLQRTSTKGDEGGDDRNMERQGDGTWQGGKEWDENHQHQHHHYDHHDHDEDDKIGTPTDGDDEDDTPDFRTMSFVAWFNYLQVGILVIEFMQLFSFPLRELMEFYNQVAKTSAMYESAKGILNAIQAASLAVKDMANEGLHGFHYQNGTLSIGDKPLFRFSDALSPPHEDGKVAVSTGSSSGEGQKDHGGNTNTQDASPDSVEVHPQGVQDLDDSGENAGVIKAKDSSNSGGDTPQKPTTAPSPLPAEFDSTLVGNVTSLDDWKTKMPKLDDATSYITPWIKNLTDSAELITHNMPRLLPNISALLFNATALTSPDLQHSLKDKVVKVSGATLHGALGNLTSIVSALTQPPGSQNATNGGTGGLLMLPGDLHASSSNGDGVKAASAKGGGDDDIVLQIVNGLGLQPSINTHDWYLLRFWSCVAVVAFGWLLALFIHAWNRRSRALLRAGKSYWPPIRTFLSSAACQSQAIHAYAHEKFEKMEEQAQMQGEPNLGEAVSGESVLNQFILALLDPSSTVSRPATSLLCTDPKVHPPLYMAVSLLAYMMAHLLFMVFLTSFEQRPVKGEICFRPHGVAILKNLGLLLAVDFLLIQAPSQRRFRGLVSIAIMLAMACYTIKMRPCYWNKLNYWRTFSFSCVLYASLLVALLCPSPIPDKVKGQRVNPAIGSGGHGRWVMAPNLNMGHAWLISGGPKVVLAWIAAGWFLLIIVFMGSERIFLRSWTRKKRLERRQQCREEEEEEHQRQQQQQQQQAMHPDDEALDRGVGVSFPPASCPPRTNRFDHRETLHQAQQPQQQHHTLAYSPHHDQPWEGTTPSSHSAVAFPTYQPQTPQRQPFATTPSPLPPPPPHPAQGDPSEQFSVPDHTEYHSWKIEATQKYHTHSHAWEPERRRSSTSPAPPTLTRSSRTGTPGAPTTLSGPAPLYQQWRSPMSETRAAESHWSVVDLGREERIQP
ncbi:hypothetical protein BGZ73_005520 [Actinomortierella ambigua]|nr:hypothetical protein BGZ73_005520 [Actinomortierella ambigua]